MGGLTTTRKLYITFEVERRSLIETCAPVAWKVAVVVLGTLDILSGAVSNRASVGEKVVGRALMLVSPR